jgi:hypothetical protein
MAGEKMMVWSSLITLLVSIQPIVWATGWADTPCHFDYVKKVTVCRNPNEAGGASQQAHTTTSHITPALKNTHHAAHASDHIKDLNHILSDEEQGEIPLLLPHNDDFFKGKLKSKAGQANWDYISRTPDEFARAWQSSWSPDGENWTIFLFSFSFFFFVK